MQWTSQLSKSPAPASIVAGPAGPDAPTWQRRNPHFAFVPFLLEQLGGYESPCATAAVAWQLSLPTDLRELHGELRSLNPTQT